VWTRSIIIRPHIFSLNLAFITYARPTMPTSIDQRSPPTIRSHFLQAKPSSSICSCVHFPYLPIAWSPTPTKSAIARRIAAIKEGKPICNTCFSTVRGAARRHWTSMRTQGSSSGEILPPTMLRRSTLSITQAPQPPLPPHQPPKSTPPPPTTLPPLLNPPPRPPFSLIFTPQLGALHTLLPASISGLVCLPSILTQ